MGYRARIQQRSVRRSYLVSFSLGDNSQHMLFIQAQCCLITNTITCIMIVTSISLLY
jgi:hypothetical protein